MPIIIGDIKLFTLEELSTAIGTTTVTLRSYISKGGLKARKMGGKFFISEDALKEYFLTLDGGNIDELLRATPKAKGRAGRPKKHKDAE